MAWQEHSAAPARGTRLCDLADVPDGEGREFVFGVGDETLRLFVVRRGEAAWAYRNVCPHNYIALNDVPDRFVSFDHEWIVCSTHGAVFRYEDGWCEDGPCKGRSLEKVEIALRDGAILLA